ncbi:MAG: ADP-ribosylglycohydrolase family protein, partial [Bacillota bacterium]|nr:ADP-ribosylglycohydrolase family protein [Bacillota bacterium]
MAGWERMEVMLAQEFVQLREEGRLIDPALVERAKTLSGDDAIEAFFAELRNLPPDPNYPYAEPDAFADIAARAITIGVVQKIPYASFLGAMLGRCIGCALGKPLETG